MIVKLSGGLSESDCRKILYLDTECSSSTADSLAVLSSLEANGHISPWSLEHLESLLQEIDRHDLLSIVNDYKKSKEYKEALRERKKGEQRKKVKCGHGEERKRRLRALYALLITHITGLTQVMEILREELDRIGEGEDEEGEERVEQAMQRFLEVERDGGEFMDNLHRMFREMEIKPKRDSTSSDESPPATPTRGTRHILYRALCDGTTAVTYTWDIGMRLWMGEGKGVLTRGPSGRGSIDTFFVGLATVTINKGTNFSEFSIFEKKQKTKPK